TNSPLSNQEKARQMNNKPAPSPRKPITRSKKATLCKASPSRSIRSNRETVRNTEKQTTAGTAAKKPQHCGRRAAA
ncbi:hypothetical protein, partial [Paraburkholderia sediminicola]|uniref:hypothetical protein n=1 Tax=Paraburkholderia sediminicola TaxID=458836 RepID=UPI0038BA41A7